MKKTFPFLFFLLAVTSFSQTICTSFDPANFVLNGNAAVSNSPEVTLTNDQGNVFGTLWSSQEIVFNEDFLVESELFFGNNDWGADGIAFVLQPLSSNAGSAGGGIGYAGIIPSIAIEFDTYYNTGLDPLTNDHVTIVKNGQAFLSIPQSEFITPIDIGNVENGQWHSATFQWTASTQKLKLIFDGIQLFDLTIDLTAIFPNINSVFWGFTSATGSSTNLHKVKINNYCVTLETNNSDCCTNISSLNNNQTLLNTYYPPQENQLISPGATSIILDAVPTVDIYGNSFGDTPIQEGDLLMLIQMQGANYNSSNSTLYGAGIVNSGLDNLGATGYTDMENTGNYEYVIALNDVPLTGGILQINGNCNGGIQNTYQNILSTSNSIIKRFQVIRVPRFQNLTLNSNIETTAWNGKVGGVIAFVVSEDLNLNGYTINASGKGFRGGYQNVRPSGNSSNIISTTNNTLSSGKGEGISGTPRFMWNGINAVDYGAGWIGYMGGDYGRGAAGNAGGGGNIHNAGGGGGGNGGFGGIGGNGVAGFGSAAFPNGGRMGGSIPFNSEKIVMGGGGGGGDANNATTGVKGGPGGGVIILQANKINGSGQIISNGLAGEAGIFFGAPDGAGGGGSGGSVMILTEEPSPLASLVIEVKGGKGGNTLNDLNDPHGPGGGGGGGIVMHNIQGANLTISNNGGLNGKTGNGTGISHGASPGQNGLVTIFDPNNLPDLIIDLYPNPISDFSVTDICLGETIQPLNLSNVSVLNNSSLISYHWDFGDGTISSQANPTHLYGTTGNYTISLEVTTNWGCKNIHNETVTVNPNITPTFTQVAPICSGATLSTLSTISNNGFTGTWLPALNNTATTTYTFTPTAGQCATTATMTITVNPNITPTFTQVAPICSGATLSTLTTNSNNGITGTWSPALNNTATTTYTFTPTAGQCATTATMTITVNPNITPTFTQVAPICSGATLSTLPTISNNGITGTWLPALNNTATTTYTFTPTAGQCATTATMTITVNPNITPTFTQVAPICSGATLSTLTTNSNNGITGTWSPALNNTATTTYTFTPTAGQCATTATMTITVNPNITPTFTQVAPICSGATLSTLPTISNNGITGTWLPALNNTATTTYTFTPTAGQCATTATMTITVNPNITPTFTQVAPICSGATLSTLPTISNNGITGTWLPALNNTATTSYTFTPTAGQCATTATMTITVNPNIITPTFTQVAPICSGATLSTLPTISNNGFTGTWLPALNNTATTTYTFTPTAGQCATTATMTINVNPLPLTPTGNSQQSFCAIDGPTINDLILNTTNVNWYTSASGGSVLNLNFSLTNGLALYAAAIDPITLCENPTRYQVQVQVENPQLPSIEVEQEFCIENGMTLGEINTNGTTINWYNNLVGGSVVPAIHVLQNGDVFYGAAINSTTGCESTTRIPIEISIIDSNLSFFNLITIDDNDLNKELIIQGLEQFPNNSIEIYNRYGNLVWSGINYDNVTNTFKGMASVSGVVSQGSYLPTGTYFFILSYPNNCEKSELKGFIQIDNKR